MNALVKVIRILSQHHPMYLYHITESTNIESIAENGLDKDRQLNLRDPSHQRFDIKNKIFFVEKGSVK